MSDRGSISDKFLFKTILYIVLSIYQQYWSATATGQNTMIYCLQNMTARINMLPFQRKIANSEDEVYIDFGNLETRMVLFTDLWAYTRRIPFQFTQTTLFSLAKEMNKRKIGEQKSVFILKGACNQITINELVFFLSRVDHDNNTIIIYDDDIDTTIYNAWERGTLKKSEITQRRKG